MGASEVVLAARGISKSFPGVKALEGVDLTLRRGRLTAVLGENGAGKSTLMNVVAGIFSPDAGQLFVGGREVHFHGPRAAQDCGIATVFQELNLFPHLTVAENIFLGREPLTPWGLVDDARLNRQAARLLEQLDLAVAPRTPLGQLRVGQQQVVEIAKALSCEAKVIILDEPTSAITEHEIEVLFQIIADLKRQGVAIAYITHKLEELARIADDAVVLRDGKLIGAAPLAELSHADIVRMMVGRELRTLYEKPPSSAGEAVLEVEHLCLRHPRRSGDYLVHDVSFSVRRGEVLGIFGLMGAGRTELLETLFGLHAGASTGRVVLDGAPIRPASPADAIAQGLALAPEDRKGEGLVLEMGVDENASLAGLARVARWGLVDARAERRLVERSLERFRVRTPSLRQPVRNLSGGNQQKVILAKWLATAPKVLLLDEPTRGIDINAKREVYALIDELAGTGLAVVLVSSELPEIMAVADRIVVLCEGKKTAELTRLEANEETIMNAALPKKA